VIFRQDIFYLKMSTIVKIVAIGDPHYKKDNLLWMKRFEDRIHEIIYEEEPHLVVVLGDTLDRFKDMTIQVQTQAQKFLRSLSGEGIRNPLILIGNHDRINNNVFQTDESPFYACKFWDRFNVCDTATSYYTALPCDKGYFRYMGVPYVHPGRFQEAIDTIIPNSEDKIDIIFAHQEFENVKMGSIKSEIGDHWPEDKPLVITGHVHEHQLLQKNILYVGSPHHEGTVSIIEFNLDTKEFIERRIKLNLPTISRHTMTPDEVLAFDFIDDETVEYYRVEIKGTPAELKALRKTEKYKELLLNKKVKLISKPQDVIIEQQPMIKKERASFSKLVHERLLVHQEFRKIYSEVFNS